MDLRVEIALLAIVAWTVFVVLSCVVFALRQYLDDRKQTRLGDFLLEDRR